MRTGQTTRFPGKRETVQVHPRACGADINTLIYITNILQIHLRTHGADPDFLKKFFEAAIQ